MIESSRAYQYAKWCTQRSNQKVGRYVKLQARAWLRIAAGKHKEAYVSEPAYRKICRLLGLMVHPDLYCTMDKGLEDYAWFLIVAVFCTLRREDDRRFYETALLEIARKNFKTFNSAVVFIIGLLTEPRFSRFFSVAPDYKLSSELRLAVRKIIKVSPALVKHFKVTRDMITCLITETEYMPLAYSNDGMDGRLANIFLADEAGALDSYPVEAMRSSQITLANKLGIIISTQYPNDNNVLTDEIDIAKKVLDRADELLEEYAAEAPLSHKGTHHVEISKEAATDETQGSLFGDTIRDTLMGLDVMTMTPLEAMNTLYQLAEEAKREGGKLS